MNLKLGFVGTGAITDAIIRGALKTSMPIAAIHISPRNAQVAAMLAVHSHKVKIAADNQAVVDNADLVFLAIRPQIAQEVIEPLTFRPGQRVVSLIAAVEIETLANWIGEDLPIIRAIPLPFVAELTGATAIYPPNREAAAFFDALGKAVEAATKHEFDLLGAASALMGTYFGVMETTTRWLQDKGMPYDQGKAYLATLFASLADVASRADAPSFETLRRDYSTKGGLNEQVHGDFDVAGGSQALRLALDGVLARIQGR